MGNGEGCALEDCSEYADPLRNNNGHPATQLAAHLRGDNAAQKASQIVDGDDGAGQAGRGVPELLLPSWRVDEPGKDTVVITKKQKADA